MHKFVPHPEKYEEALRSILLSLPEHVTNPAYGTYGLIDIEAIDEDQLVYAISFLVTLKQWADDVGQWFTPEILLKICAVLQDAELPLLWRCKLKQTYLKTLRDQNAAIASTVIEAMLDYHKPQILKDLEDRLGDFAWEFYPEESRAHQPSHPITL